MVIKREKIRGKYYWVNRENNIIIEKTQYQKGVLKKDVEKHLKKYGFIDTNVLHKENYSQSTQIITKEAPKKLKRTQYKGEYELYINGKKLNKPLLEPYSGVSSFMNSVKSGKKEAQKKAFNYHKARLMNRGLMKYEDNLELKEVSNSFITWRSKPTRQKRNKKA